MAKKKYYLIFTGYPEGDESKKPITYNIPCRTKRDADMIAENLRAEGNVWGLKIKSRKLKKVL